MIIMPSCLLSAIELNIKIEIEMLYSLFSTLNNFNQEVRVNESFSADFDKFKKYSCPLPCVIESFSPKTSFSRFPSNEDSTKISDALKLNGTRAENHKFLRFDIRIRF